jgi:hypothetical protein
LCLSFVNHLLRWNQQELKFTSLCMTRQAKILVCIHLFLICSILLDFILISGNLNLVSSKFSWFLTFFITHQKDSKLIYSILVLLFLINSLKKLSYLLVFAKCSQFWAFKLNIVSLKENLALYLNFFHLNNLLMLKFFINELIFCRSWTNLSELCL